MSRRAATLILLLNLAALSACGRQNWYEGARSAQQADCMQQPLADYNDCMQPALDSFNEYEKKRQAMPEAP